MKYLLFAFCFLLFTPLSAELCSEILISEIVFVKRSNNFDTNIQNFDFSVELYNPTDQVIELNQYSLEFYNKSENNYRIIILDNLIQPNPTFVISNQMANEEIISKTDLVTSQLNFENVTSVHLSNGESIIDEFGNKFGTIYEDGVDIERLLNDSEYLNSLSVNFSLLKGLSIRRSPLVREGNLSFQNSDFLEEWSFFPSVFLENLGLHESACHQVFILWDGINNMNPEVTLSESDENFGATGSVILSEPINELVEFEIIVVEHIYKQFPDGAAFATDYNLELDIAQTFQIPALSTERVLSRFITPVPDGIDEIAEGVGFRMFPVSGNVVLDTEKNIFDVRILDPLTSIKDIHVFSTLFSVYPTIVNRTLNVVSLNYSHLINSITIFDSNAVILKHYEGFNNQKVNLDLGDLYSQGVIFVKITTEDGIAVKKVFKH